MQVIKIDLYEYFGLTRPQSASGYLQCILHAKSNYSPTRIRPAMIVVAGGGYSGLSDREGEPIASAYFAKGFNAFIMDYSVAPVTYPAQLIEGAMAMAYIRKNAQELGVDKEGLVACGFSAGGHFCQMMASLNQEKVVKDALKGDAEYCYLNAVILGYPVITAGEFAHRGSIVNLTGNDSKLGESLSLENRVTTQSAPAFIWGTVDDDLVPSENSLLLAKAYKANGVPFELHLYEKGHHGMSLANLETATELGRVGGTSVEEYISPAVATWLDMSVTFMENRSIKIKD